MENLPTRSIDGGLPALPRGFSVQWSTFLASREQRRLGALRAATALAAGDDAPAIALLADWLLNESRARVALALLMERPPDPDPQLLAATLTPGDQLPPPAPQDWDATEFLHRRRLARSPLKPLSEEPVSRLAWALEQLAFVGSEVERRERRAWADTRYPTHAERDGETAGLWAQWFSGSPWGVRERWEKLFLPAATRVFHGVCAARKLPQDVMERSREDLREAFFFRMLSGELPGWAEVAARTLETSSVSLVVALASLLDDEAWARVSRCAATRGSWADTAHALWPEIPGGPARGLALRRDVAPPTMETLLDLHVVMRLVNRWHEGACEPDTSWGTVVQNRGRARGRLRAISAGAGGQCMLEPLMALDSLHARTDAAVRRYAWAWAWRELAHDFSFNTEHPIGRPCVVEADALEPIGASERATISTWILLVILKGRQAHLERWIRCGGTGDRDSTWARLLADDLPQHLADPEQTDRRARSYHRLRADLAEALPEHLVAVGPALTALAQMRKHRGLRAEVTQALAPLWDPRVPFPKSGFPTFLTNARTSLQERDAEQEDAFDTV